MNCSNYTQLHHPENGTLKLDVHLENETVRKFRIVQQEGKRQVKRLVDFYNLDMIISVGYRVKSHVATRFRIWATRQLTELIKNLPHKSKGSND